MRIGLLLCDHVNARYQRMHGTYPTMFKSLLPDHDLIIYDLTNDQFPSNINDCDGYITSGSRQSVYEDIQWIHRMADLVRNIHKNQKKFVGLCFGHQMIGHALAGKVEKSPMGWCVGVHCFNIMNNRDWMLPPRDNINVLMMCQDQITQLPKGGQVIASSPMCPNAIIQIDQHILGIQCHPEFTKEYDKALMEARISKIGKESVAKGIISLDQKLDTLTIKSWINEFLTEVKR